MTILFAGTSISDFDVNVGGAVTTSSSHIDTAVVSEGIDFSVNAGAFCIKTLDASTAEGWIGFKMQRSVSSSGAGSVIPITVLSGSTGLFRLNHNGTGQISVLLGDVESFNGSVWAAMSGGDNVWNVADALAHKIDVNIKLHASVGFVKFYFDGALLFDSGLMNTILAGQSTFDTIKLGSIGCLALRQVAISEVFVSTTDDSRDVRIAELTLGSNGTNTAWTGSITDIDETGYSDADFISAASASLTETFVVNDIPGGLSAYDVLGVVVSARSRHGGTGPQNVQNVVRVGSTDYMSASVAGMETAFRGGLQGVWETNPNTASGWTQAEVNGIEIGVASVA